MKTYNAVIVYKDGTSRSTSCQKPSKEDAILHIVESDMDKENIINLTIVEAVKEYL